MLAARSETITPAVGSKYTDADSRICRRCLGYTWSFYEQHWPRKTNPVARWVFRPTINGAGKWHIANGDLYPKGVAPRMAPACGSSADLRADAKGIPFIVDAAMMDSDSRLCRHCLKKARYASDQPIRDKAKGTSR